MTRKIRTRILVAFLAGVLLLPAASHANLLIMPVRIIFKDRDRMHDINVINTRDTAATFRIFWRYQKQNETGGYDELQGPIDPATDPAKMLVFSPRQVTLEPQAKQKIRMSLRRPPDLPDGEYRIHLVIEQESGEPLDIGPGKKADGGMQTRLGMNVGVSVPVVIRQGRYDGAASVSNPTFVASAGPGVRPSLEVTLTRSGIHGTMGKLLAFWTPPGESERQIGYTNNVNVFTDTTTRKAKIYLEEGQQVSGGTLRVVYEGDGPDKGITFDEKTVPVGG